MFYLWIILAPVGVLALLVGMGLGIPKKTRRVGLVILAAGITLVLIAWHMNSVATSVAKAHQRVQIGMTKVEVQALLGFPDRIASADTTGKLQVHWTRKDLDIPGATIAWEYRPYGGPLHMYRVYFNGESRVMGKAAD